MFDLSLHWTKARQQERNRCLGECMVRQCGDTSFAQQRLRLAKAKGWASGHMVTARNSQSKPDGYSRARAAGQKPFATGKLESVS